MHIETLKIFCDLAETLSFSKTAEKNLLSQSSVSQQLAQLELQYKCQLIDRKKRPISLTKEGQFLFNAGKDIIERLETLNSELNKLKNSTSGRINVAAIYSIGMHTLPNYLKHFMAKYPNIHVHVEYLSADKIYESVLSGEIDIGLVAVPKRDKRLEVYDFEFEPLTLVCSPKNPLANEKQVDIHKVEFERFIGFSNDVPTRGWIDGILQRYGITVRPVMEFDNIETIKRAVEINTGISILPQIAVISEVNAGTLKAIPFVNEAFTRPTGIIFRKDKVFGQAARYLLELLQNKV
jgi:DNA-binding transcriptional LysR family regulator